MFNIITLFFNNLFVTTTVGAGVITHYKKTGTWGQNRGMGPIPPIARNPRVAVGFRHFLV